MMNLMTIITLTACILGRFDLSQDEYKDISRDQNVDIENIQF
jgi:hypothetical protein